MFNYILNTHRIHKITNNKFYTQNVLKPVLFNRLKLFFVFSRKKTKNVLKMLNVCFFLFYFFKGIPFFFNFIKNQKLVFGLFLNKLQIFSLTSNLLWNEIMAGRFFKNFSLKKNQIFTVFSKSLIHFRIFQMYLFNYYFRLLKFPNLHIFFFLKLNNIFFNSILKIQLRDVLKFFNLNFKIKKQYLL